MTAGSQSANRRRPLSAHGDAPVPLSVLLLCGGSGRRFGGDKGLALFRGQRLIERLISRLAPLTDDLRISTNHPDAYRPLGHPVVSDRHPGHGPLGGLQAGLQEARYDHLAVVACDLPFASPALLDLLRELAGEYDVVVPVRSAQHRARRAPHHRQGLPAAASALRYEPVQALYHRRCLPAITHALQHGERKLVAFYDTVRVREVAEQEWGALPGVSALVFENINTPADLARLEAVAAP